MRPPKELTKKWQRQYWWDNEHPLIFYFDEQLLRVETYMSDQTWLSYLIRDIWNSFPVTFQITFVDWKSQLRSSRLPVTFLRILFFLGSCSTSYHSCPALPKAEECEEDKCPSRSDMSEWSGPPKLKIDHIERTNSRETNCSVQP